MPRSAFTRSTLSCCKPMKYIVHSVNHPFFILFLLCGSTEKLIMTFTAFIRSFNIPQIIQKKFCASFKPCEFTRVGLVEQNIKNSQTRKNKNKQLNTYISLHCFLAQMLLSFLYLKLPSFLHLKM